MQSGFTHSSHFLCNEGHNLCTGRRRTTGGDFCNLFRNLETHRAVSHWLVTLVIYKLREGK